MLTVSDILSLKVVTRLLVLIIAVRTYSIVVLVLIIACDAEEVKTISDCAEGEQRIQALASDYREGNRFLT